MSGGGEDDLVMEMVREEYDATEERVGHWIQRELRQPPGTDHVKRWAYLTEQLRKLTPGTEGDAAAMAAVLIIHMAREG